MPNVLRLIPPTGGVSRASGSQAVPKDQAVALSDFLVDQPGRLVTRGPFGNPVDLRNAALNLGPDICAGTWIFGEKILVLYSDGRAAVLDVATGATTPVSGGTIPPLKCRSVRIGTLSYVVAGLPGVAAFVWSWDGVTPPALITDIAQHTNGPNDPVCVEVHLGRLFVGGGSVPGTATPVKHNNLYWSDIGGPQVPSVLVGWEDDVSGLVNQLVIGDDGDAITGLASFQRQLLVFKNNSVWSITGDAPSSFVVRRLISNLGCATQDAILVADDVVLFAGTNGQVMLYDGAQMTRLYGYPATLNLLTATLTRLSNDYFMVTDGASAGLLYLPTRAWISVPLTNIVLASTGVRVVSTESGKPYILDGKNARSLSALTTFGNATEQNTSGTTIATAPRVTYRLAELDTPWSVTTISRMSVDHALHKSGGSGTPSWLVTLQDVLGVAISSPVVAAGSSSALQRALSDLYAETDDLSVTISLQASGGVPTLDAAALQDVWFLYQAAQQR